MKNKPIPDILAQERQRINVLDEVLSGRPVKSDTTLILSQLRYDYSLIPEAQRDTVQDAAVEIVRHGKLAQENLIEVGKRLIVVKELLDYGQFEDWCSTEFQMSPRTVQNMMNVARTFEGRSEKFALLGDSTMYLLAAPSTPEAAREQVIAEAEATGSRPKVARVKEVIAQHRPAANVVPSEATHSRQQGAQLATCSMCHRPLSDPASAIAGVGPCCAAKRATAAGSGTADDDDDDQPLKLATVADDDDILAPDRHEAGSAAQQRNARIDRVTKAFTAALDAVNEFEALTGAYTLTPALRRAIEPMLRSLEGNRV